MPCRCALPLASHRLLICITKLVLSLALLTHSYKLQQSYSWFDLLFFKGCNDTISRRKHTTYTGRTSTLSRVVAPLIAFDTLWYYKGFVLETYVHLIYYHKCAIPYMLRLFGRPVVLRRLFYSWRVQCVRGDIKYFANTFFRWPTNTDSPDNRHETSQGLMFCLGFP